MSELVGWLIVHTEDKEHDTFELKLEKNIIGRPSNSYIPDVPINDQFVSRRHAVVFVRINENNFYEYFIADNPEVNEGKASLNGTYVNGNKERLTSVAVQIYDGDTLQIGMTKLVLKTSNITTDSIEAIKLVKRQEYQTTVDFNKLGTLKKRN